METSSYTPKQKPLIPAGQHVGICYSIVDLGSKMESFKGNPPEKKHQVMLTFEFPGFVAVFKEGEDAKPMVISQKYTLTFGSKANLAKALCSWRNIPHKELDAKNPDILLPYLGQYAAVQVVHNISAGNGFTYDNIQGNGAGVASVMDGVTKPKPVNPNVYFDIQKFSWDSFKALPEWQRKIIRESLEWPDILGKNGAEPAEEAQAETPQSVQTAPVVEQAPAVQQPVQGQAVQQEAVAPVVQGTPAPQTVAPLVPQVVQPPVQTPQPHPGQMTGGDSEVPF